MMAMVAMGDTAAPAPAETELTGKLGCGHCQYQIGKGCSTAFKTADGKIYIIDNPSPDLKKVRFDSGTVKVTGKVSIKEGQAHVEASKQELVK